MKRKRKGRMKVWRQGNEEGKGTKEDLRGEGQQQEARRIQRGGVKGEGDVGDECEKRGKEGGGQEEIRVKRGGGKDKVKGVEEEKES